MGCQLKIHPMHLASLLLNSLNMQSLVCPHSTGTRQRLDCKTNVARSHGKGIASIAYGHSILKRLRNRGCALEIYSWRCVVPPRHLNRTKSETENTGNREMCKCLLFRSKGVSRGQQKQWTSISHPMCLRTEKCGISHRVVDSKNMEVGSLSNWPGG